MLAWTWASALASIAAKAGRWRSGGVRRMCGLPAMWRARRVCAPPTPRMTRPIGSVWLAPITASITTGHRFSAQSRPTPISSRALSGSPHSASNRARMAASRRRGWNRSGSIPIGWSTYWPRRPARADRAGRGWRRPRGHRTGPARACASRRIRRGDRSAGGDRTRVRWSLGERLLYHVTPFGLKGRFFRDCLAPRFAERGLADIALRERNWSSGTGG